MQTKSFLSVATLATALLLVGGACSKSTTTETNSNTANAGVEVNIGNTNAPTGENTNGAMVEKDTKSVSIADLAFAESSITVKKGTKVTWTNNDSVSHTVTSTTGTELSSSTLSAGASYSNTFSTAGTYAYKCTLHPTMTGTVIVTE